MNKTNTAVTRNIYFWVLMAYVLILVVIIIGNFFFSDAYVFIQLDRMTDKYPVANGIFRASGYILLLVVLLLRRRKNPDVER